MRQYDTLPKLVASDIGGTLAQGIRKLPAYTTRILNCLVEQEIPVVLITGFNYRTTQRFAENLDSNVMLMPQNGTLCLQNGELVWEYRIPPAEAQALCTYLETRDLPIIVYKGKNGDFTNFYTYHRELPLSYAFERHDSVESFENITGISTILPDNEARQARAHIQEIMGSGFKVIYTREETYSWLEVVHQDVRKDQALKRLAGELDIPLEQVIYFGDNFNDLEVLRLVGYPVVMENAVPELREEFHITAPHVNAQGVAHYLNLIYKLGQTPT